MEDSAGESIEFESRLPTSALGETSRGDPGTALRAPALGLFGAAADTVINGIPDEATVQVEAEKPVRRSPLILIVDDDPLERSLVCDALQAAHFECAEAADGDDGLRKCASLQPDLVIMDVVMPGRDGFSICTELKSRPETCLIPVLMATALDDVESIERAFEAGAANFVTKPIQFALLSHTVKYILSASKMERQIREAARLAEESSAAKSLFLANVSHELRTPLNTILGFSEIIHAEVFGPDGYEKYLNYAKDIHDSAQHLLNVINDILDLTRIGSGQFEVNETLCQVPDLFDQVVGLIGPHANEASLSLKVEVPDDLPPLLTDGLRLKQVLINLISNSIKFTPTGGQVTVRVQMDPERRFVISVSDNGVGIPPSELSKAMLPFGQVGSDLSKSFKGSGLGLPLAKTLTEQLGGDFHIASKVGQGTTVTLTFSR